MNTKTKPLLLSLNEAAHAIGVCRATPLLLSLNEAAHAIGVCRATFYKLLDQGCFESVKIGTRRLIVQESLIAYVESLKSTTEEG